jgi:DNA repair protein RadA/Sms
VRIDEPGADLGIALAIASAAKGAPVREGVAAFGEIGLTGRLRAATQTDRRLEECRKFGSSVVIGPDCETLRQALAAGLAKSQS